MNTLNQEELLRYKRHFPVIGTEGQLQLKNARVLCVGAGGLGCPALQYLAAAGVGTLGIIDGDHVEMSNLQRQILFQTADMGCSKAETAKKRLLALNPDVTVNAYNEFLSSHNVETFIRDYHVVLDATDNYTARYLLNDACRSLGIPLVSASIYQFDAQLSVFNYQQGPCYQCLYEAPPPMELTPNCALGGVLGVLPGVIGTMQATEAIKIILEKGTILSGVLLSIDLLSMRFQQFSIEKQACVNHPHIDFSSKENKLKQEQYASITALELSEWLRKQQQEIQLIDVRQPYERDICHIGGLHIPLHDLEQSLDHLSNTQPTVLYCRSGARSAQACRALAEAGFTRLYNLEGGIIDWIETVDPQLSLY